MTDLGVIRPDVLVDTRFDQHVRWTPGERLDQLFEQKVDALRSRGHGDRLAVDAEDRTWTYAELDARANQLARHLSRHGVRAGDRMGLLFDHAVDGYVGMLATLKLNAAYVPLDAGFPTDRLAYICRDAGVRTVVTCTALSPALSPVPVDALAVDAAASAIAAEPADRLTPEEQGLPVDEVAYIIYTSGSTGRPKGVAIEHASICNFVRVAAEVYGATAEDRFYQGMTIAFDFSVEEIWVPWMVGATLVPKPFGGALVGNELSDFLRAKRITGLCCVPTLLATMEQDVPDLRFLLVSGEACPQDLIARWFRPDRRFLNVYGPTEATVTATWSTLDPGRRVTIGTPLPTYSVIILYPDSDRVVAPGEAGEICIGGVALSSGYVNRPDLTAKAFIHDSVGLPNNPSGRLYRTGDLGRIDEDGNIEYLGRIDLQVKIRGYRIELSEIESVLLQYPGIATAVVEPFRPDPDTVELVAYYCRRGDAVAIDPVEVQQLLRDRLPGYMVPVFFTELDKMPMLPSHKVDRKKLPPPDPSRRQGGPGEIVPPEGPVETGLARILAETLHMGEIGATSHFFDDLGGNSLLMARFCGHVREHPGLGAPTMRDIYRHPSVRTLAAHLSRDAGAHAVGILGPTPVGDTHEEPVRRGHGVPTWQYVGIAVAQTLLFALLSSVSAAITVSLFYWYTDATGLVDLYLRSVGMAAALLGFMFVLPLVAKWTLMGRARVTEIPVWGLAYLRFWIVRRLTVLTPARLTAGTPVFGWYLRLLGARVGRGATIYGNSIPTFPDLLTIGDGAVVLRGAMFNCYRVEGGIIQSGPVTIGARAFVGGHAVLDIDTGVGDDAQLGHASCLLRGQRVPARERWHGSPAVPTGTDYLTVPDLPRRPLRGVLFGLATILFAVAGPTPGLFMIIDSLVAAFPVLGDPLFSEAMMPIHGYPANVIALAASLAVIPITLLGGLLFAFTVPRLFNLLLKPDRLYPLYGIRYWALRRVRRFTNTRLTALFGDSNYITWFLSWLGYKLKPVEQSGSNFGMMVDHDVPYLVRIGTGTMVSDGLSLMNAEYSSTAFRLRPTVVGERNFFGNGVLYPPDAKVGDNCLLATKVLLPLDGEVRHDVGLLGSPAFEIPRSVNRDAAFDQLKDGPEHHRRLRAKLRLNTATIGWSLLALWGTTVITSYLIVLGFDLNYQIGFWGMALVYFSLPLVLTAYGLGVEWAALGFRRLRPQYCSLYDPIFWRHERYWKLGGAAGGIFAGTPYMGWVLRAHGTHVGRQFFNDGGFLVERSLTTIGDYVTLNQGVNVQGHSMEDGTFKSGPMVLEDGCTLGTSAFVHYSTRVGPGAVIEADSFLMKGEDVPAGQRWHGNPAMPAPSLAPASPRPELAGAKALVLAEHRLQRGGRRPRRAQIAAELGTMPTGRPQPRRAVTPAESLEEPRAASVSRGLARRVRLRGRRTCSSPSPKP